MEKEKNMKKIFITSEYNFDCSIDKIWDVIKTFTFFKCLLESFGIDTLSLIKDSSSNLNLSIKSHYSLSNSLQYVIDKVIETSYFCQIKWKCTLKSQSLPPFTCLLSVHATSEDQSLFVAMYDFPHHTTQDLIFPKEPTRQIYYKRINQIIYSSLSLKIQYHSEVIKGNIDLANSILSQKEVCQSFIKLETNTDKQLCLNQGISTIIQKVSVSILQKNHTNIVIIYLNDRIRSSALEIFQINSDEILITLTDFINSKLNSHQILKIKNVLSSLRSYFLRQFKIIFNGLTIKRNTQSNIIKDKSNSEDKSNNDNNNKD